MIEKLNNHYSFTSPASVYDEESLTALQLAGRQGAKINEVIDDQNKLRTETENHLNSQDETIDRRMDDQDSKIENHKTVEIPEKVKQEFQNNVNNGTFDGMIDEHAGNLTARLNNLLSHVPEDGNITNMDAEVIDTHTGGDDYVYSSAGEAIRGQYTINEIGLSQCLPITGENLVKTTKDGMYQTLTYFNSDTKYCMSNPIYLVEGEKVYIDQVIWGSLMTTNRIYKVDPNTGEPVESVEVVTESYYLDGNINKNIYCCTIPKTGLYVLQFLRRDGVLIGAWKSPDDMIRSGFYLPENSKNVSYHIQDVVRGSNLLKRVNLAETLNVGYWASIKVLNTDMTHFRHTNPILLYKGEKVYTPYSNGLGSNNVFYLTDENFKPIKQIAPIIHDNTYCECDIEKTGYYIFQGSVNMGVYFNVNDIGTPIGLYLPENTMNVGDFINLDNINPLYGKKIVFDGDSICHGTSVGSGHDTYGYGWAGRIGERNTMEWENAGVSGGTLVSGVTLSNGYESHCISRSIDTIHTNHPELDYIIFEGGTNDADHFLNDDSHIGTFDVADYSGEYDDSTFYGALDSLFYKTINYYPTAKIGFIIAPKMGRSYRDYTKENNQRRRYFEMVIQVCKKWGVPFINLWDESPLNPKMVKHYNPELDIDGNINAGSLYTDGQHLTAKGYDYITTQIETWIKSL